MQPTDLNTQSNSQKKTKKKPFLTLSEMALFAMFGALMFTSKVLMEFLPNIHLLGMFIMVFTIVFRAKALIPLYIYVFLNGVFAGFDVWWVPYLYIWTILWGVTMLLPKRMPRKVAYIVYPIVCCLHGLFFGALYAPVQALLYGYTFEQTLVWISMGLSFDILHCVGDFCLGFLVLPVSELLKKLVPKIIKNR
jgi:energy-coupling factor transport system substrate-specific component